MTSNLRLAAVGELHDRDHEFIALLEDHPPKTRLQYGDLVVLKDIPPRIASSAYWRLQGIPRVWKVHFVVSLWQFEMHNLMHERAGMGIDEAVTCMEMVGVTSRKEARTPIVYAHGFPHFDNPNTCEWFFESSLKKMVLRTEEAQWEEVLDEFKTPFLGYDPGPLGANFILDMAPDMYGTSQALRYPLQHEEKAFETACSDFNLEELLLVKNHSAELEMCDIDQDHDVFVYPWG